MPEENLNRNVKEATDFLGNTWKYDCMGCAISRKELDIPGGIIFEGKYSILGADPEIPIPGFLVLNTKRHVNSFSELEKEEYHEIMDIIVNAEKALRDLDIAHEVTIVQEERSKHLHVWIFPNYSWMTEKFGKGITHLRAISEYARENSNGENVSKVLDVIEKVRYYFEK